MVVWNWLCLTAEIVIKSGRLVRLQNAYTKFILVWHAKLLFSSEKKMWASFL